MLKDRCTKKVWYWEFTGVVDGVASYALPRIILSFVTQAKRSRFTLENVSSQGSIQLTTPSVVKGNSYVMAYDPTGAVAPDSPIGLAEATQLSGVVPIFSMDESQKLYTGTVAQWV